jgi:hypothetical protein
VHAIDQIGPGGFDDRMKMIVHHTPGMHLPVGLLTSFVESSKEELPVRVVGENGLAPVPTVYDMINGTRTLNAECSGHTVALTVLSLSTSSFHSDFR